VQLNKSKSLQSTMEWVSFLQNFRDHHEDTATLRDIDVLDLAGSNEPESKTDVEAKYTLFSMHIYIFASHYRLLFFCSIFSSHRCC